MNGPADSLRSRLQRLPEACWLAAAVLIPLAVNPWETSSFELPKAALLRTLVLLAGLATLLQARGRTRRPARPAVPMLREAGMLALVLLLATTFSVNPRISLTGSLGRQQGLLTWLSCIGLFAIVALNLSTEQQARRLLAALVWGSVPIVLYGFMQALGQDPFRWQSDAPSRMLSTLGRSNFFGSYLVLLIPLTLTYALLPRQGRAFSLRIAWPYFLLVAGQTACLALTLARGAWMGFLAAGIAFGLGWAFVRRSRRLALATIAVALVMGAGILLLNLPVPALQPLAELPGLDRLATLSQLEGGSTAARLTVWKFTLPLVLERPWFGYGPETFYETFVRIFPPQLVYYQGRHVTVDRAHNLWLDLAMTCGVLGVACFVALLVAFSRLARQGLRESGSRWQSIVWVGLAAAATGHVVDQQFIFSPVGVAGVFWLALGLAAALGRGLSATAGEESPGPAPRAPGLPTLVLLAVAFVAAASALALQPLRADMACWQSYQNLPSPEHRIAKAQEAVRRQPGEATYRQRLSWLHLQAQDFASAEEEMLEAERLAPNDPRILSAKGELYALWGEREERRFIEAEKAYRRTISLAPHVATYHTALGLVLAQQGRLPEALKTVERAVDLDATDGVAYAHLARLYESLGRYEDARRAQEASKRWGSTK